jgi:hypothetical protein
MQREREKHSLENTELANIGADSIQEHHRYHSTTISKNAPWEVHHVGHQEKKRPWEGAGAHHEWVLLPIEKNRHLLVFLDAVEFDSIVRRRLASFVSFKM